MTNLDIYTYFSADQMRRLLIDARYGTAKILREIRKDYPNDFRELIEAIADCMPQLVAEDRTYKQGPRKGQRKIVFCNNVNDISGIVAKELTGCASIQEFIKAYNYCGIYGGPGLTMVETVLAPPVSSDAYAKLWIKSFLDDKARGFPNLKQHYLNMTIEPMRRSQAAVDLWLENNSHDMAEIMTWTGDKYNEWHFNHLTEEAAE
jgi:hypothetical protein